jgi:hypothetical protein
VVDLVGLSAGLREVLVSAGWGSSVLLETGFEDDDEARGLLQQLVPFGQPLQIEAWVAELLKWKGDSAELCRLKRARLAVVDLELRAVVLHELPGEVSFTFKHEATAKVLSACVQVRWRTKREKLLSWATGEDERQQVEAKERAKWIGKLIEILQQADLPVVRDAQSAMDPVAALMDVAGSRRSKTIRARVRRWLKVSSWLMLSYGVPYPITIGQMLDYLRDLEESGSCPRSAPEDVAAAWAFVEKAGGVRSSERLTDLTLWTRNVQALKARLLVGNTLVRKAPHFSVAMILSLELLVCSCERPLFVRALGWLRLLKCWTSMRWDDTMGLAPGRMRMTGAGFVGVLVQTKTTGPGKKVWEVEIFVRADAGLTGRPWLVHGFEIWSSPAFCFRRDYFLPLPMPGLEKPARRMAEYADAAALGRSLLRELRVPVFDLEELRYEESNDPLLPPGSEDFWTEHSERHWLSSLSVCLNVEKTKRDIAGRWGLVAGAAGSNSYVLTAKLVVHQVQQVVCEGLCLGSQYDESDLLDSFKDFVDRLCGPEEALLARSRMEVMTPSIDGSKWGLGHDWPLVRVSPGWPAQLLPGSLDDGEGSVAGSDGFGEVPLPPSPGTPAGSEPGETAVAEVQEPPFWMSLSGKKLFRRLHRSGGCKVRQEDCANWQYVEELVPGVADAFCKFCWRAAAASAEISSSESESSSGSSSEEE